MPPSYRTTPVFSHGSPRTSCFRPQASFRRTVRTGITSSTICPLVRSGKAGMRDMRFSGGLVAHVSMVKTATNVYGSLSQDDPGSEAYRYLGFSVDWSNAASVMRGVVRGRCTQVNHQSIPVPEAAPERHSPAFLCRASLPLWRSRRPCPPGRRDWRGRSRH